MHKYSPGTGLDDSLGHNESVVFPFSHIDEQVWHCRKIDHGQLIVIMRKECSLVCHLNQNYEKVTVTFVHVQ